MRTIVRLSKSGGSLCFNVSKAIKTERLDWKEGDYFAFTVTNKHEAEISRLSIKKKAAIKESKAATI